MLIYDVGIIGGCASGLVSAVNVKRQHPDYSVIIFEKLPRIGKKILATGNGRCNITNINITSEDYNNNFVSYAVETYSPERVIGFFNSIGLYTYADPAGRVYPRSNTAASVLDALRFEINKLDIEVVNDCQVKSVKLKDGCFTVNESYRCSKLIIAAGGKSSPAQGSDGSGYALAKQLGHGVTQLYPGLAALNCDMTGFKSLKGIRAAGVEVTLYADGLTDKSSGEILFTDTGISGIAAMDLSYNAAKACSEGKKTVLSINFLPEYSKNELVNILKNIISVKISQPVDNMLSGLLPKQIGVAVLKKSEVYGNDRIIDSSLYNKSSVIADNIRNFNVDVTGTKGFENAQITCGGVSIKEVDSKTMQSLINPGLYFCGEILDVNGRCGGYNLNWAFASGLLAGELK